MTVEEIALGHLLERMKGEYRELPGLSLTLEQAARLWSVDRTTAAALLGVLVNAGFLCQISGTYVRTQIQRLEPKPPHVLSGRDWFNGGNSHAAARRPRRQAACAAGQVPATTRPEAR